MTEEQKKRADEIQKELREIGYSMDKLIGKKRFYKRKCKIARFFCNSIRDEYDEIYLPSKVRHEIVQILINYENELKEEFAKL